MSFFNLASVSSPLARVYISGRRVTTASFVLLSFWAWNSLSTKDGFLTGAALFRCSIADVVPPNSAPKIQFWIFEGLIDLPKWGDN